MLGHLYVRYFADLFGGQQLATPTKLALGLEREPRFYDFDIKEDEGGRKEFIDGLYGTLNEAGERLGEEGTDVVRKEAILCFSLNKDLYSEPGGLLSGAIKGGWNVVTGYGGTFKPNFGNPYGKRFKKKFFLGELKQIIGPLRPPDK